MKSFLERNAVQNEFIHQEIRQKMHCIATRCIGLDELFIDYKTFAEYISTEDRRKQLEDGWDFICHYVRCECKEEISEDLINTTVRKKFNTIARTLRSVNVGQWNVTIGATIIAYQLIVRK